MKEYFASQFQKKTIAALVEDFASRYGEERFRYGSLCYYKALVTKLSRFYIASQVTEGQKPVREVSGEAHATAFLRLVNTSEQAQWEQRHVRVLCALNGLLTFPQVYCGRIPP
jgi:hypothetical protein